MNSQDSPMRNTVTLPGFVKRKFAVNPFLAQALWTLMVALGLVISIAFHLDSNQSLLSFTFEQDSRQAISPLKSSFQQIGHLNETKKANRQIASTTE